jgi:integrase/recombinase XerD
MSFRELSAAFRDVFKEKRMRNSLAIKGARSKQEALAGEPFEKTLAAFSEHQNLKGFSVRTMRGYGYELAQLVSWLRERGVTSFGGMTEDHLSEYQAHLAGKPGRIGKVLAASTRNRILSALVSFARFLVQSGRLVKDPSQGLAFPRVPRKLPQNVLSEREMEKLLAAPRLDDPVDLRNRALMELLYATAVRQSEALDLKLEHVDLAESEVRVERGKGGKGRIAPLCKESCAVLAAYLTDVRPQILGGKPDSGYFFVSKGGKRLDPSQTLKAFKRYAAKAGITRPVGFHTYRHSCATHLMKRGVGLRYVQELLGHASLNSTQVYTHVSIPDLKRAHAKFHPREKMDV